jgi:predicted amidophosphoribosyltransferase
MDYDMAKDFIARFANQLAELYSKLLPTPCLLCGVDVADKVLCPACIKALPKIGQACQRCAYPIESAGICGHCLHSPPAQDRSFSAFIYQTTASRLISKFKYQQQLCLTDFFCRTDSDRTSNNSTSPITHTHPASSLSTKTPWL